MRRDTISVRDFSIDKLEFSNWEDIKPQYWSFPKNSVLFETDWITILRGGICPLGEFIRTEESRRYMELNIGSDQRGCVDLLNMMKSIDNKVADYGLELFDDNKITQYLKKGKRKYMECVKGRYTYENDNEYIKKGSEYCKIRVSPEWTSLLVKDEEDNRSIIMPINMNKFAEYIYYKSQVRVIFSIDKFWIEKNERRNAYRNEGRHCGITFTAVAIEAIPFVPVTYRIFRKYSFVGKDGKIREWDDEKLLDIEDVYQEDDSFSCNKEDINDFNE